MVATVVHWALQHGHQYDLGTPGAHKHVHDSNRQLWSATFVADVARLERQAASQAL